MKTHLRTRWVNPGLGRNRPGKHLKAKTYGAFAGDMEGADTGEPDPDLQLEDDEDEEDDDDEEEAEEGTARGGSPTSSVDESAEVPAISILDLHSDNPLMSYNGSVYSCQWATNVGTELLFMAHDRDSPLPVMRKLAGGVDLLAASSARLISNPVELEARKRKRSPDREYERGSRLHHKQRMLPVGEGANDRRKDQATFLENLANIKDVKGEDDEVSLVVEKRLSNRKWKAKNKSTREAEKKELRKIIDSGLKRHEPEDVASAEKRLQEMNEEDIRIANLEANRPKPKIDVRGKMGKKKKTVDPPATGGDSGLGRGRPKWPQTAPQPASYSDVEEEQEDFATPDGRVESIRQGNEDDEQEEDEEGEFFSAGEEMQGVTGEQEEGEGDFDDDDDDDTQL